MSKHRKDHIGVFYSGQPEWCTRQDLPSPRLQLRYEEEPTPAQESSFAREYVCYYEMILPLEEDDCRRADEQQCCIIRLSLTNVTTRSQRFQTQDPWQLTPFRDGVHISWDNAALDNALPMYVIKPDGQAIELPPRD